MKAKAKIIIAIIVVIALIAIGYFVMMPKQGGGGTTTTPTETIPTGNQTTTAPPTNKTTTSTTNTTTIQIEYIDVKATIHTQITTTQEKEKIMTAYISVTIKKKVDATIYIVSISIDNVTPTSPRFIEGLYYEYDPIKEVPKKGLTWSRKVTIPEDLMDKWGPGTKHTITIVYKVDGKTYKKTIWVTVTS